jgi:RNA polymerase sigma-70 factor (ECF subfamily)
MHEAAGRLPGLLSVDVDLRREFDDRAAECSTLAFRVAFSVLRHRQDAEDVAQDALLRAYRGFHAIRDRERFRAWLVRTTWRLALDRRRADQRRLRRDAVPTEQPAEAPGVIDAALAEERAVQLWQAIDRLPEKLRLVVVLAAIEEANVSEVASLLDVPAGTVKSRLHAARQQLKGQLHWTRTPLGDK